MRRETTLVLASIAALAVLELGSQTVQPAISITVIPAWGQDGQVTGIVSGVGSQSLSLYLFAFVPDMGWAGLPGTCSPVSVQGGQFSVNVTPNVLFRAATRFTAYLVPSSLAGSCSGTGTSTVPFVIQHNAIATATYPRLPGYSTISFAGLNWYVKDAPVQVYPGPQFFVKDNAFVDSSGQLHLRISPCGGSWCAAEIYTKESVGYGSYRFTINSQLSNLDRNVTLGLFTWDAQAGDLNNREWDIEFSRWGNAAATPNAQYVVQPYNGPNNIQHFVMSPSVPSTHVVSWSAPQVGFSSSASTTGSLISQWTFTNAVSPVPTPGDVHLHLNFYVGAGQAPSVPTIQEIVISGFQYSASSPQIGFPRSADSISFRAGTYSVPLSTIGSNCGAFVESDSPWLTVAGSNVLPAGVPLQYSVTDNIGGPRSGNLILQGTACNATLGGQVLTVTQAGLVCAPAFATPSTHFGSIQSSFSVGVNGTASACTWQVASSAPWMRILSGSSGAGDGTVQVTADANADPSLRGAVLSLNNGQIHSVYQDSGSTLFALSPLNASTCGSQSAQIGVAWSAPNNVELHLNSPSGAMLGQFGPSGSTVLSGITDGSVIFLVQAPGTAGAGPLASGRVTVLPANCNGATIAPLGVVNAASYAPASLAAGSLATIFGSNLSAGTSQPSGGTFPTTLGGATVTVTGEACPLWFVSPGQINFAVPANLETGRHTLTVGLASTEVLITPVSPGIFTLKGDGTGVPLATVTGVLNDGSTVSLPPYQCTGSGCSVVPITVPDGLTDFYIVLYGTGVRNGKVISATLGSMPLEVVYAGAQGQYQGLDQINLHLKGPVTLSGTQSLRLQADGVVSNAVSLQFQ
ncbi:MAG TPA: BACON domain-containing carbohydrate-binding protein [Bryobacteraceae bacterium]|nr:BACON domain-containing carbohydrate-binding protein [Bryobacteraceae bacterium]